MPPKQQQQQQQQKEVAAKLPDKPEVKSYARRDFLQELHVQSQKKWADAKIYESNADPSKEKYFVTFPYPYMNGKMHLGHAFSVTKAEFMGRYQRMLGKNVLFPFGFHCTGMPIKACADKLRNEIAAYGFPPVFPPKVKKSDDEEEVKYQWEIMAKMGFNDEEIANFQDAYFWLKYFPPLAKTDLQAFGLGVDFRRSFITTDANPYYDAFTKWQFETLKQRGKISFGKRYSIFSPLDNQICADHDRAKGEGVKPKDYTIVKLQLLEPLPACIAASCQGKNVYLAAATLRPETMYGQTNCWLKPDGEYGAFEMNDKEVLICSERSARNMSFQDLTQERGQVKCLAKFTGQDIMGHKINAPNAPFPHVHILPMLTIDMKKTTGVVTSVPSDSPADFAALNDLKQKPKLREKYGLTDEMVLPFDVVPIINIPNYDGPIAPILITKLKIQSQNDTQKLEEAKDIAYGDGFNHGVMNDKCGQFAGMKVKDAKDKIKQDLTAKGLACPYSEPESQVISRSGDVCVVALTDQWFLAYGEHEWKKLVDGWLEDGSLFSTFHPSVRKELKETVDWLREWGCSRSYGLGTKLPWDQQFLIESLSDSTVYMAYYTIAHMLHADIDGKQPNPEIGITSDQVTSKVLDYIFLNGPYPADQANVPAEDKLKKLKAEFEYWYPVDLRVSGKDLIKNHLTMFLYNHTAMWPSQAESKWPRAIFANGYIQVEGEKMSKSKGNFLTMEQVCNECTPDATRIALADAGDSLDDANFTMFTANSSVLRLFVHLEWVKEMIAMKDKLRKGPKSTFADEVFENKINQALHDCKHFYETMQYREVLKAAWFDFEKARDDYRLSCQDVGMHEELVFKWIESMTLMMAPITPHISEHVWSVLLDKKESVVTAKFPEALPVNKTVLIMDHYIRDFVHQIRIKLAKEKTKPARAFIYVADAFLPWQLLALNVLATFLKETGALGDTKAIAAKMKESKLDAKLVGSAMAFIAQKQEDYAKEGSAALSSDVLFDEQAFLTKQSTLLQQVLGDIPFEIYKTSTANIPDPQKRVALAQVLKPQIAFSK